MIILKETINIIFSISLFINAMLFVPQIITLLKTKNSKGISVMTFAGFNLIQLFIILHGIIEHDYWLIFGYALSLLTCGTVTFLIVLYRSKIKNNADVA